jgi:ribosomal protein L37E
MGKDFDSLVGFILLLMGAAAVGKIISDATKKTPYKCPRCGEEIFQNQDSCPSCGSILR